MVMARAASPVEAMCHPTCAVLVRPWHRIITKLAAPAALAPVHQAARMVQPEQHGWARFDAFGPLSLLMQ